MGQITPLTVLPDRLKQLSVTEAVDVFRMLLCAECFRRGIPRTAVNVPSNVNTPDGGIDATVETGVSVPSEGLITTAVSRFQIKTGESFKPWQEAAIHHELFGENSASKDNLGPAVRKCMEDGGRYAIVCFGIDIVAANRDNTLAELVKCFRACGYGEPKVEVYGNNQLRSLIEECPALAVALNPNSVAGIRSHRAWAEDKEMSRTWQASPKQQAIMTQLRDALQQRKGQHIRVLGEPGIGKTRMVLEATRPPELASQVLYCDASRLLESALMDSLINDERMHAILIVDECDSSQRALIDNRLGRFANRVQLVSLHMDADNASGLFKLLAPPLEDAAITSIIEAYGIPKTNARQWTTQCSGYPRVAHVVGQNLKDDSGNPLAAPSSSELWTRYVQGMRPQSDPGVAQTLRVLRFIALFQKFGYLPPHDAEAKAIAAMVHRADPTITWERFQEIIKDLLDRRVLQGDRTLYITPRLLHIWLWTNWWDTHGNGFDLKSFLSQLTGDLNRWFTEMMKYARGSPAATECVNKLLGPDGPFKDGQLLKEEVGAHFLLALTEASPEAALACLERTVGAWSHQDLLAFESGRSDVRFALERIVVWKDLCVRGARLLLKLAAAENEAWSNNSTGIFAELFMPGFGDVSPTEASLSERFPLLREAMFSNRSEVRSVALKAAARGLETGTLMRTSGAEFQGLRSPPQLWRPQTWGEIFDAYRRVWQLLEERLNTASTAEQREILKIMTGAARGLILNPNLAKEIISTLQRLATEGKATPADVIGVYEDLIYFDKQNLKEDILAEIVRSRDALIGSGFKGRLHRFVGLRRLEGDDDHKEEVTSWQSVANSLAEEIVNQPTIIDSELPWLASEAATNAGQLGIRVGRLDKNVSVLERILSATRSAGSSASLLFLSGYMAGMKKLNGERWEAELDRWSKVPELAAFIPEVTWRSGVTDRAMRRLLDLVRAGDISVRALRVFCFGQSIRNIGEPLFRELVRELVTRLDGASAGLALELVYAYFERGLEVERAPADVAADVVLNPSLFTEDDSMDRSMGGYIWAKLATSLITRQPSAGPQVLSVILDQSDVFKSILNRREREVAEVARQIFRADPQAAWDELERRLNSAEKLDTYKVLRWLGGNSFVEDSNHHWNDANLERLWKWIDDDVENRAWMVATVVPKVLTPDDGGEVTRELLIRYGDRDDVKRNLAARFISGSWWGEASDHYANAKRQFEALRDRETEPRVREWLSHFIEDLDSQSQHFRISEERE